MPGRCSRERSTRRCKTPEEYAAWKERLLNEAEMEGKVEGGLMPAGQCAAAVHDMLTVREVIERTVEQGRALLTDAARSAADLELPATTLSEP